MAGETRISIIGNLAADPELRFIQSGKAVVNFTVVSTPRTFDRQANDWKDGETLNMRCTAWGEVAENVAESLSKGDRVMVVGNLVARSYESNGEKRWVNEIQVDEVGPSLRYATAKPVRKASTRGGGGFAGGQQAPAGGSANDPWASTGEEPPF